MVRSMPLAGSEGFPGALAKEASSRICHPILQRHETNEALFEKSLLDCGSTNCSRKLVQHKMTNSMMMTRQLALQNLIEVKLPHGGHQRQLYRPAAGNQNSPETKPSIQRRHIGRSRHENVPTIDVEEWMTLVLLLSLPSMEAPDPNSGTPHAAGAKAYAGIRP